MESKKKIYLDYAATTPLDSHVLEAMVEFGKHRVGNASSIHSFGRNVASIVDEARSVVAGFLHCNFTDIIFTSGATEANNIAIHGLITKYTQRYPDKKPHIITTPIEHSSVLEVIKKFEAQGVIEVSYLTVGSEGVVDSAQVKSLLRENTLLVSVMYVNNEIGTVQPIREIGKIVEKFNNAKEREVEIAKMNGTPGELLPLQRTYFHCDATQATLYYNCDVLHLHVDMLSFSSHKLYGPTGVGVLYVKSGTPLDALMQGGDQELALRPGTHNAISIVGMAKAISHITPDFVAEESQRLLSMRDYVITSLQTLGGVINGSLTDRAPNNIHVAFPGQDAQMLLYKLDAQGFAVSTGSACSSGASLPSHVITALGHDTTYANSCIRITIGKGIEMKHLQHFLEILRAQLEIRN